MQHADIHQGCSCYQKGDKQIISQRKFPRGESRQFHLTSHHIIFVLDGAVKYSMAGLVNANVVARSGEFIFLPVSTILTGEALEDTSVLWFRLGPVVGRVPECPTFRFQRLAGNITLDQIDNETIYPLTMTERIRYFINGVVQTEQDGLKCANYARHIVAQLLTMIQVYYPQEEYMRFYSTVVSPDLVFTDKIYEKWMECRSVGELANYLHMSTYQFSMRFSKVFGETPGQWLKKRRNERLYRDVCSSNKSLREIASEHSFSVTNLIRYCRENFGETPGKIRENLTVGTANMKSHVTAPRRTYQN